MNKYNDDTIEYIENAGRLWNLEKCPWCTSKLFETATKTSSKTFICLNNCNKEVKKSG